MEAITHKYSAYAHFVLKVASNFEFGGLYRIIFISGDPNKISFIRLELLASFYRQRPENEWLWEGGLQKHD